MISLQRAAIAIVLLPWVLSAAEIGTVPTGGIGTNGFRPLVADDRPETPLLAPASGEGVARIKQFRLPPELHVDLWASEPMLANAVAFSVDEQGRVWTGETYRYRTSVLDIRHYMFMLEDDLASRSLEDRLSTIRKWFGPEGEKQLSRETEVVRLLEDTQHVGHADKSTVVIDGLNSPLDGIASGILARHGEVWLTDIPSLWKFSPQSSAEMDQSGTKVRRPNRSTAGLASSPRVHTNYTAEALLTGFGIRFSFTGHDLHGLKLGPDGRLYFSCGDRGTHVETQEGTVIDLPDEGAVFRCEPDGSHLEVFARGLRNPQELAFDEFGNLFTGDNDSDQGDRERWEYVVEGGDYGWRVGYQHAPLGNAGPWNMERLWVPSFAGQAAYIIPPIANIGDGPSGLVYDYGTCLPKSLRHRFLLADFKGTSSRSGIYSILNRPFGAGFQMIAHDTFIWNVLVPDVDFGPDGSIWFSDWHEGWPKSNKGRLYRAYFPEVTADPIVTDTARLLREGMKGKETVEQLKLLGHPDMRVRQEAQFALAANGTNGLVFLMANAITLPDVQARIHCLWAIDQVIRPLSTDHEADVLASLIPHVHDTNNEVAVQAVRVLSEAHLEEMNPVMIELLNSPNPRLRYFSLLGIAKLWGATNADGTLAWRWSSAAKKPPQNPLDAILRAQGENAASDPLLRHAGVMALTSVIRQSRVTRDVSKQFADQPEARLEYLLALRRCTNGAAAEFLSDPSPAIVLEAARAINDVPILEAQSSLAALAEPTVLDRLSVRFKAWQSELARQTPVAEPGVIRDVRADQPLPWGTAPIDEWTPLLIRVVNANFRLGTTESAHRLAMLAGRSDLPDLIRTEAVFALGTWAKPHPRDRVVGVYRPLESRDSSAAKQAFAEVMPHLFGRSSTEAVQVAAAEAATRLSIEAAEGACLELLRDTGGTARARAAALRALVALKATTVSQALDIAMKDSEEILRLEGSRINAELHPENAAAQLSAKLSSGTVAEQQGAFAALGDLKSDAADAILADWLDRLMRREVANEVMLDLVEAAGKRSASAVKTRLEAYGRWKLPQDHLTPYREALYGGDAAKGKKIFYENAAVACTRCHHIGADGGGNAGPVLDGVATRQPREYLLESIVFPNQQIAAGFETASVTMKNGTPYSGTVKGETDSQLILLSPEDGEIKLEKSGIQERAKGLSGMPEGLVQFLSRQELRDVVAFLSTLK